MKAKNIATWYDNERAPLYITNTCYGIECWLDYDKVTDELPENRPSLRDIMYLQ